MVTLSKDLLKKYAKIDGRGRKWKLPEFRTVTTMLVIIEIYMNPYKHSTR